MKQLSDTIRTLLSVLFIAIVATSCGPSAEEKIAMERCAQEEIAQEQAMRAQLKNTFDAPFPGRNRNLSKITGDTLQVAGKCYGWWEPLTYKIESDKKSNTITNVHTGQVLFKGTVCKFKGLYYFSEQVNDSSYRIFAMNITDTLIYGLQNYIQYMQTDTTIEKGRYPKLLKYINKDKHAIRLHPDKRELRKLFASIMAVTIPVPRVGSAQGSTIITDSYDEEADTLTVPGEIEMLKAVYPNPATDHLTIELQQHTVAVPYYLTDLSGKMAMQGKLHSASTRLDISNLQAGTYVLTIVNTAQQKETVKIIKAK